LAKQLRVFQLAKELGVTSKAIVNKCKAEGIESVKGHMSVLSAGLAASIREWFSEGADVTTVETAERVDLTKVRRKPRRRKKAAAEAASEAPAAVAEAPAATAEAEPQAAEQAEQEAEAPTTGEAEPAETAVAEQPAEVAAVDVRDLKHAEEVVAPVAEAEAPAAKAEEPAEAVQAVAQAKEEAAPVAEAPQAAAGTPGEQQESQEPAATAAVAGEQPSEAPPEEPVVEEKPKKPEPVRPAGPQLVAPLPPQIQGPRVIRLDRPEPIRRYPRRGPRPSMAGAPPAVGAPAVPPKDVKKPRGKAKAGEAVEERPARPAARGKARARRGVGREVKEAVEHLREWRDRDLLERQERLQAAAGRGLHARRATEKRGPAPRLVPARKEKAQIHEPIVVKELCATIGQPFSVVWRKLTDQGVMARLNDTIDAEVAQLVAMELGVELEVIPRRTALEELEQAFAARERKNRQPRPPVVAFLGHVDHGKTSLLDRIRNANVVEGEAGGITQHIGAHQYERDGWSVTFLDTPGHEAFTALRARGANLTDIVVLVVAADDGVMPQTVEAIRHARAADVPILVALNTIDLPGVDINRIYSQLSEQDLVPTEWGGETDVIKTSAVTGEGIDDLLEHLHTLGELMELQADPTIPATGAVVETQLEEGTGPLATVLVTEGTLRIGDVVVCGGAFGRVRAMLNHRGQRIEEAGPSTPVQIAGLDELPQPGDAFYVVDSLQQAKHIAEECRAQIRERSLARTQKPTTLEELLQHKETGELPELNVIIKADVLGSVEVLRKTLEDLSGDQARVNILHAAVGGITEGDVLLADASKAVIVGFNVVPEPAARRLAEQHGVRISLYRVIYDLLNDLKRSLEGLLEPEKRIEPRGRVEVREVFKISRVGTVAGGYVAEGIVSRNLKARILRDNVVVRDGAEIESLRRYKDDVTEVRQGMECGIKIAGFDDIRVGDVIETYEIVEVARTL